MKNVGYRNAWAFLDGYRGKEFQGKWPGVNEMFHISVLRFPDHLAFHSFEPETKLTFLEAEKRIKEIAGYLHWLLLEHCIQRCRSTPLCQGCPFALSCRKGDER